MRGAWSLRGFWIKVEVSKLKIGVVDCDGIWKSVG